MKVEDIEKGIEEAIDLLNKNPIQMEIEDEPRFVKRLTGTIKTKDGKDCTIVIIVGIYDNVKDLRLSRRGMKNWALIRGVPFDQLEDLIKGPGIKSS